MDALIVFKRAKSTLVDLKNQQNSIVKFVDFKSTIVDFAYLNATNASKSNIMIFERKPQVWRYFRIPSTSLENSYNYQN